MMTISKVQFLSPGCWANTHSRESEAGALRSPHSEVKFCNWCILKPCTWQQAGFFFYLCYRTKLEAKAFTSEVPTGWAVQCFWIIDSRQGLNAGSINCVCGSMAILQLAKACKKRWEPSTSSERQPSTVLVNYFVITSNAATGLLFGHKEAAKCKIMPGCSSELILNLTPKIYSSHQHKKWTLVRGQCHPPAVKHTI